MAYVKALALALNLSTESVLLEDDYPSPEAPMDTSSDPDYIYDELGHVICEGPTQEEMMVYMSLAWWLEGIGQMLVGGIGFLANCVAIPILCSKEMSSIFNRLLTCLAVFDNIFIICSVLESIRKHIGSTRIHEYLFGYFLYQFHNMIMCCSAYITVVLALERYRAVWRPIEYHNTVNASANPWRRVFTSYIGPVVVFSVLFNMPKFFETEFEETVVYEDVLDDLSNKTVRVGTTVDQLSASDMRLDDNYVLWYSNVARLAVTGVVPFASLAYLNSRIYAVLRRRRRMTNRPQVASAASAAQKAEETRQAVVLFVIVILFVLCHALRILLNVHELLTLDVVRASIHNGCFGVPLWALIAAAVSHFLITVNSSVNFFIYCFMCTTFRRILLRYISQVCWHCFSIDSFGSPITDLPHTHVERSAAATCVAVNGEADGDSPMLPGRSLLIVAPGKKSPSNSLKVNGPSSTPPTVMYNITIMDEKAALKSSNEKLDCSDVNFNGSLTSNGTPKTEPKMELETRL